VVAHTGYIVFNQCELIFINLDREGQRAPISKLKHADNARMEEAEDAGGPECGLRGRGRGVNLNWLALH
jgi:hypothetical protein